MDEIIYALKSRVVGLNCGRWDYIFSAIKTLHQQPGFMLPERGQIAMSKHFLNSYAQLLIQTCHKRGILAMGGMAAQIPNKRDAEANAAAFEKVRGDKQREADLGHDGTWVAHPGLIPLARGIFDQAMYSPLMICSSPAMAASPQKGSTTRWKSACAIWPHGCRASAA
jgi:malate synthase